MSARPYDPQPAARVLADAWRSGEQLLRLPEEMRPLDLMEGYDTQDAFLRLAGEVAVGWKLGVGSPRQLRDGKLEAPIVGRVLRSQCYETGHRIAVANDGPITFEFEVAFVLGRDLPPHAAPARVLDAVSHMCMTIECVQSRFVDRRAVGWPSFAADNCGFRALVIGPALALDRLADIETAASLDVAGQPLAHPQSGDDRTDPVRSLQALYAHAAWRGTTLRAGQIVSTGAMAVPRASSAAEIEVSARYLGGEIGLRIVRIGNDGIAE